MLDAQTTARATAIAEANGAPKKFLDATFASCGKPVAAPASYYLHERVWAWGAVGVSDRA